MFINIDMNMNINYLDNYDDSNIYISLIIFD